jgi:hypothetical protein
MTKPYKKSSIPDFPRIAQRIRDVATGLANAAVREFATEARDGFQQAIRDQDFASFASRPLSPRRLMEKLRAGADLRTMIATSRYVSSIRVFHARSADGRGGTFRIGFRTGAMAHNLDGSTANITLDAVARINEGIDRRRGTSPPARPHWRPYLQGLRRRARVMREDLARRIVREARKVVRR